MNPLLFADYYKTEHFKMYPDNMTLLYSNFTPRKSRMQGVEGVVVFGIQHFILEYLIERFNKDFFFIQERLEEDHPFHWQYLERKKTVIAEYKRHINVDTTHIEELWDLGYLPLEIKALPEGTICPIGVPCLTIKNTHPKFAWLVNYFETLLSAMLWQPITSATIAHEYRKILIKYAKETDEKNVAFVDWQGHDFSMRGMSSIESAILSGMGHLLSFTGTDSIPAIYQMEKSYQGEGLIGASVPATEHSVMCMGTKESEVDTFKRLLNIYPSGILSVVSDTWDLWKVCTEYLPALKEQILAREGKLVIRPDSGDPVDIICGTDSDAEAVRKWPEVMKNPVEGLDIYVGTTRVVKKGDIWELHPQHKGVVELLWDVFGGTVNEQGYKVLDSHIGVIYGDSITPIRAKNICERLKAKGFASTNVVLGIGSMTYTGGETDPSNRYWVTRDLFGFAMKATYGEITSIAQEDMSDQGGPDLGEKWIECRQIFKDPITDDGTKKSKKGLLSVKKYGIESDSKFMLKCIDQVTWEEEKGGELQTVFLDGQLVKKQSLQEIRERLNSQI